MRIFLGIMVLSLTAGILAAQTNRSGGTPTPPAAAHPSQSPDSAQGGPVHPSRPVLPGDIVQVETNAPATALLKELKERADLDHAMSPGTNEIEAQLSRLEPTGQFVERYVRMPSGNPGEETKVIRCLVPVFRIKH